MTVDSLTWAAYGLLAYVWKHTYTNECVGVQCENTKVYNLTLTLNKSFQNKSLWNRSNNMKMFRLVTVLGDTIIGVINIVGQKNRGQSFESNYSWLYSKNT